MEAEGQLYRSLLKSPEWAALVKVLDGQAENRLNDVMNSIGHQCETYSRDGMAQLMVHEFEKGVRAGILLVKDLPRALGEYAAQEAEFLRAEMAKESIDKGVMG